jgi:hypothetical protein
MLLLFTSGASGFGRGFNGIADRKRFKLALFPITIHFLLLSVYFS